MTRLLDLFAGPGGWDEGARMIGHEDVLGVEWDRAACETALAAGHARLWADVAALDPHDVAAAYGPFDGLIASPPCQAWSMAGKRKGEQDRAACHALADRMAAGDDDTSWTTWEDARSSLVCEPVRWIRELRPTWVALEEVPAVASLWEHFARIFRTWGYSVWTGDLCAADYGVPQTRTRRILLARRDGLVAGPPEPTHAAEATSGDLFGGPGRQRWVSMAEALGWRGEYQRTRGAGMVERHGPRPTTKPDEPAPTITSKSRSDVWVAAPEAPARIRTQNFTARDYAGQRGVRYERDTDCPAPVVTGQSRLAEWVYERPATTVAGDPRIGRPGHKDRDAGEAQFAFHSVKVTVAEAGVLQSFARDYPWRGSRTKQYQQVGNAVPPLLAAHVLAALVPAITASLDSTEVAP